LAEQEIQKWILKGNGFATFNGKICCTSLQPDYSLIAKKLEISRNAASSWLRAI
jgi:hypothetical protein